MTEGTASLQSVQHGVGVVGPAVQETSSSYSVAARDKSLAGVSTADSGILTHDMVSRTHLQIFDTYYPTAFDAWSDLGPPPARAHRRCYTTPFLCLNCASLLA